MRNFFRIIHFQSKKTSLKHEEMKVRLQLKFNFKTDMESWHQYIFLNSNSTFVKQQGVFVESWISSGSGNLEHTNTIKPHRKKYSAICMEMYIYKYIRIHRIWIAINSIAWHTHMYYSRRLTTLAFSQTNVDDEFLFEDKYGQTQTTFAYNKRK